MAASRLETAPVDTAGPPADVHHSPGLAQLSAHLERWYQPAVLDLGPPLAANVDFLTRRVRRLTIADLAESAARRVAGVASGTALLAEPLACPPEIRYHGILLWDLLNYLTVDEATRFVARLAERCRPGGLVFTLVWTEPTIPARPMRFHIGDGEHLRYENVTRGRRPAPGHQAADVERIFRGFETTTAVLLRHHVQEYLVAWGG